MSPYRLIAQRCRVINVTIAICIMQVSTSGAATRIRPTDLRGQFRCEAGWIPSDLLGGRISSVWARLLSRRPGDRLCPDRGLATGTPARVVRPDGSELSIPAPAVIALQAAAAALAAYPPGSTFASVPSPG